MSNLVDPSHVVSEICGVRFWGFLGILNPKRGLVELQTQKGPTLRQNASFEPSYVKIGRAVWSVER